MSVRKSPAGNRPPQGRPHRRPPRPELPADPSTLPIANPHAAGIDVGDGSHWVCTRSGVCEFPSHTAGLRELVDWLL